MAFLFQDQNQGIRNEQPRGMRLSRPFSFIRTLTVGFGITPNLLTLFLWDFRKEFPKKKALAGLGYVTLTAGGDFHPALRTSAARNGRPVDEYEQMPTAGQAISAPVNGMSPCPRDRAVCFLTRFLDANLDPLRLKTRWSPLLKPPQLG